MSWILKYKVVRIVPGPIVTPWGEYLDLSNPSISEDKIKRLLESGCPYIKPIEPKDRFMTQQEKSKFLTSITSTEKNQITNTKPSNSKPGYKKQS